ncbi:hypothetical protein BCR43DRAFT_487817 [Syncephalastrum racemosum]|uniref:Uncharacterized protein n=1 Tax=Syncephalastrum racemosum TaxID=13706 RepID=A0A1X2HHP3_SYNRA|nr:hypothetical protein BCR43DRAFT_487817 [Syncephalastrum racemosum]
MCLRKRMYRHRALQSDYPAAVTDMCKPRALHLFLRIIFSFICLLPTLLSVQIHVTV